MAAQKVPGEICFGSPGGQDRLFWVCMRHVPLDTEDTCYFSTDDVLVYDPYYGDFGPLNIAQVCRYCRMLAHKLNDGGLSGKRIYHVCKPQTDTRANSILLCCTWSVICNGKTPDQAWEPFRNVKPSLVPYRDASLGPPSYPITVHHCLTGLAFAIKNEWYKHDEFDPDEYEHYERVENGDFNWIVPGKFLAFSGPTQQPIAYVDGVKTNTPETYYEYFRKTNVTGVVRFNNKVYDRKKFLDAGFNHYDLYFADGGNPTEAIMKRFIELAENEKGALAVHCKAGLGRTGTLIALYLMKWFGCTTPEIISWLRLCRPGSVIGPQQNFLQDMEKRMLKEGEVARSRKAGGAAAAPPASMEAGMEGLSVASRNVAARGPPSPNARVGAKGAGFAAAAGAPAGARAAPGSPSRAAPSSPVKKVGAMLKR